MRWIDFVLPMLPAAFLTLGFVHGLVWLRRRDGTWHLAFVVSAIALAALSAIEHALITARTPAEYAAYARLLQWPLALLVVSIVSYVRFGIGAGRTWLGALAIAFRLGAIVAGTTTGANLYMTEIHELAQVPLLGIDVPRPRGIANPWSILGVLANLSLLAFCLDAWWSSRRNPQARRRIAHSVVVGTVVAAFPLAIYLLARTGTGPDWLGTPFAFSLSFVPVLLVMAYELSVNVLASERLESALRSSESLLAETIDRSESAVASLGLALFTWNPERDALWATTRARTLFALPQDRPLALADLFAAVPADEREALRAALSEAVAARTVWDREFRVVATDGSVRWVSVHGRVTASPASAVPLVHFVAVDVSDRRAAASELQRLEREAAQQRDELAHLSRVTILSELSGSLAHELNQPLAAILGNAQAAQRYLDRDPPDLAEVRDILGDIIENDRRAGEVIRRLRSMLRKEGSHYAELDVNEVVVDALRLMRSDLLNRRVSVAWEPTEGLPGVVGDRVQVQQVLLNLVANASDAMAEQEPGSREITVGTARGAGNRVVVSVSDRGTGVVGSDLETMFQPFVTTKPDGIGLGLAVCRSIVSAHHGRIWASHNGTRGTTVQFELPGLLAAKGEGTGG